MNADTIILEPDYFELHDKPPAQTGLARRDFFKTLGLGLLVLVAGPSAFAQESGGAGRRGRGGGGPAQIGAFIHIGEDGAVTVYSGKTEVGQNVRTSLTQAAAEELHVPVGSITMLLADTDLVPYDAGTFGSQSTPQMVPRIRRAAAAARQALLEMAAEHFKTDVAKLTAADGRVTKTGTTESVGYGELTKGQRLTKLVDDSIAVTPPGEWKIEGTSVPKVNGREFVNGKHKYTSDMTLPDMLHGKILRAPAFKVKLLSVDTKEAEAMDGVKVVHEDDFVGVTAPTDWQAANAINSIKAQWAAPEEQATHLTIFDYLKNNVVAGRGGRGSGSETASADGTAPAADQTLKQDYKIAYIAHVPLEPRAALARWENGKLTVWTGTQRPFGVKGDLVGALSLSDENVRVIVPDTGSGYGGKHTAQQAIEAARLSRAVGKPVKIVWTRQEEFTWAYFRPAGLIEVSSGVQKDGTIVAWDFTNYLSGGAAVQSPYHIPGQKSVSRNARSPLQPGSYRSLAACANHFARETHMDELARLLKMDPLEFRLKNVTNDRLRGVLETAAKTFGWGGAKPAGHGFGIAVGTDKGSYIATCAEVLADPASGSLKVIRAVTAFDCGAVMNPNHLKNQIEGAMVQGLGGALFEAIEFKDGMVTNPHLADYRVPRFSDAPKIEIVLIDNREVPSSGAGETPIVGIAPAVGNAIFDPCGIRLRSMPMVPDGLKG